MADPKQRHPTRRPALPDVGVIGLVPDRWGGIWMPRHHVLTRLAQYMHVVWMDSPQDWRSQWLRTDHAVPPVCVAQPAPPPGFDLFRPGRWLPDFHRPRWLGNQIFEARLRLANQRLVARGARRIILYLWRPGFAPALECLPHDASCYHVDDEYTFSEIEQPLSRVERALIERVDQVIIHSPALMEKKGSLNPRTAYIPNGVDYQAFATGTPEPADLAGLPHPRVGYIGYVKRELDLALLDRLASLKPDWTFVLVGPIRVEGHAAQMIASLERRPNVHFRGPKPLTEVPAYTQHMDALVLPYVRNDYTKFIYPLKLHEYLATGRPVIGTPIPSLLEFSDVIRLADCTEDWIAALEWAFGPVATAAEEVQSRQVTARRHDWGPLTERMAVCLAERVGTDLRRALART